MPNDSAPDKKHLPIYPVGSIFQYVLNPDYLEELCLEVYFGSVLQQKQMVA